MIKSAEVPKEVIELQSRLVEARPMRRGSVSERWMKCGKAGCACTDDPAARHGPYFSLTLAQGGKTHSRYVAPHCVPLVRGQIEAGREFRRCAEEYVKACERWGDQTLEAVRAGDPVAAEKEATEKGGFKKRWNRKLRGKPRR